jgi:hypothetical protein
MELARVSSGLIIVSAFRPCHLLLNTDCSLPADFAHADKRRRRLTLQLPCPRCSLHARSVLSSLLQRARYPSLSFSRSSVQALNRYSWPIPQRIVNRSFHFLSPASQWPVASAALTDGVELTIEILAHYPRLFGQQTSVKSANLGASSRWSERGRRERCS